MKVRSSSSIYIISPLSLRQEVLLITRALLFVVEEIRKALKAMNLLKVLEGKEALGNKSNTKDIGEHKVRPPPPRPLLLLRTPGSLL